MDKKIYYAHGKLLLTAEYLVLDGATALALPTKQGQFLEVTTYPEICQEVSKIYWKSLDLKGECWFETVLEIAKGVIQVSEKYKATETKITFTLLDILKTAQELNPDFLTSSNELYVTTRLEFDRQWGLGTSSTLIATIAKWAKVDPFVLLEKSFGGSGYDIACAIHDTPILYTRIPSAPKVEELLFDPPFREALFFVYRNQKQDSKDAIAHYRSLDTFALAKAKSRINEITEAVLQCQELNDFEELLIEHEAILSKILQFPTVKSELFFDFVGAVKSLGGWGGDFMLATGGVAAHDYFRQKGYNTIITYKEMILSKP